MATAPEGQRVAEITKATIRQLLRVMSLSKKTLKVLSSEEGLTFYCM